MTRRCSWLALLLVLAACSSDGLDSNGEKPGEGAAECLTGPDYSAETEPQVVDRVTAELVDLDDTPLGDEEVQICGIDLCFYGASGPKGLVEVAPNAAMKKPAFKPGNVKESVRFAWLLPRDESVVELGKVHSVRLPEPGTGELLAKGETAHSNGLELSVPAGSTLGFDRFTYRGPEELDLRAVRLPLDGSLEFIDPSFEFGVVFAAAPTETTFCPPAKLTIENSAGWDPGQAVDVYLHGIDVNEEWAPYGGWAKVSDAVVSQDGTRIETTEPGLPVLGVLGFKLP